MNNANYEDNPNHPCGKRILYRQRNEFNGNAARACEAVATKYSKCSGCNPPSSAA